MFGEGGSYGGVGKKGKFLGSQACRDEKNRGTDSVRRGGSGKENLPDASIK